MSKWILSLSLFFVLPSCVRQSAPSQVAAANSELATKRSWINKTSRLLRYGKEVSLEEMPAIEGLSREEIVDRFFADPDFADTMLDFNLFFLGSKVNGLYFTNSNGVRRYIFATGNPNSAFNDPFYPAVAAAIGTYSDGDFLQLLGGDTRLYFLEDSMLALTPAFFERIEAMGIAVLNSFQIQEGQNPEAICLDRSVFDADIAKLWTIPSTVRDQHGVSAALGAYGPACFSNSGSAAVVLQRSLDLVSAVRKFSQELKKPFPVTTQARLTDYSSIALTGDTSSVRFASPFWTANPNSSTNFNRRRAAKVLKTFFCDDLTPLDVVQQDSDFSETAHAAKKSCQTCHYKLDPMAGFFRDRGAFGRFEPDRLTFDDGKVIQGSDLAAYLGTWQTIGYVRAKLDSDFATLNAYGTDLKDLVAIIRKAPEARRCIVKRLAEYVIGPGQVYDEGWIAHLQKRLDAAPTSGLGVKLVIKDMVLGKTFSTPDPDANTCYDRAPNAVETKLPCRVSFILTKYCSSCHKGVGAEMGLDLTSWTEGADGKGTFSHLNDGVAVDRIDSFQRIAARLSSDDPDVSMPLSMFIPAVDKAELFKWIKGQIDAE